MDRFLAEKLPEFSRARLQALIKQGAVKVNGKAITTPSTKLKGGEVFVLAVPEAIAAEPEAQEIPLDIVFEDKHVLVVNKPAGLVVHPAAGNHDRTLVNALLAHCGKSLSGIGGVKRPGIVHRLDKDTSGLMVVAKTDAAHKGLSAQFADHSLARTYITFVWGLPKQKQGVVKSNIGRSPNNRMKMAASAKAGKHAVTHYEVCENFGLIAAELRCVLETGRTHQIRVHMAHIGHSVIGDKLYGRASGMKQHAALKKLPEAKRQLILDFPRQALHAAELRFTHPVSGKAMHFKGDMPEAMKALRKALQALTN